MSIIGNPIMVGGGGKNISSIIITGLESTDTITCTKDGKSYTATYDSTTKHWEVVGLPLGTFTVTATNGTNTKTETVLIDIAGVYEIDMTLGLWLYKDGDPCEDVTGGWSKDGWNFGQHVGINPVMEEDCMNFYTINSHDNRNAGTQSAVSFANYSKLRLDIISNTGAGAFIIKENKSGSSTKEVTFTNTNSARQVVDIDISDLSGSYYFGAMSWPYDLGYGVKIYRVWLE